MRTVGRCFFAWLKSDAKPLGELADIFWRIEFQARGSPHVHCLLWILGAPDLDTPEGMAASIAFITEHISTVIPLAPDADDPDFVEKTQLRDFVQRLQQHKYTATCEKGLNAPNIAHRSHGDVTCRFRYPKLVSTETRLKLIGEVQGLRPSDFYVTERGLADISTVPAVQSLTLG